MDSKGSNSENSINLHRCEIQISLLEDDEDLSQSSSDDSSQEGGNDSRSSVQ